MKYILITFGLIFLLLVGFPLLLGLFKLFYYLTDLNYLKTRLAKERAVEYVEEKYNQEFLATDAEYSRPLGEDGAFMVDIQSVQKPDLQFRVGMPSDLKNPNDDYKHALWNHQSDEWIRPYVLEYYPESTKIISRISFNSDFHDVFTENDTFNEINEYNQVDVTYLLTLVIFEDEVQIKEESIKLFSLWQKMQTKGFDNMMLDVRFVSTDFKKKDYEDIDHWNFAVFLDTRNTNLKSIQNPDDIESRFIERDY